MHPVARFAKPDAGRLPALQGNLKAPGVYLRTNRYRLPILDPDSPFWHRRPIVITKVKWQAIGKVDRELGRVLELIMEVDMWLAGIAGVAAFTQELTLFYCITGFYRYASRAQVGKVMVEAMPLAQSLRFPRASGQATKTYHLATQ